MNHFEPGDIVEIETPRGLAYVQVTHGHPVYAEVIRALPGLQPGRPRDIGPLAAAGALFKAMIPLWEAIHRGDLKGSRVGTLSIPPADRVFPTFRMPIRDRRGTIVYWWLWDGEGLSYDTDGRPDIDTLPLRSVTTARALIERLQAMPG